MHDGFVIAWRETDVEQEKQHNELIHDITEFRCDKLKRTSTSEKIVLPTPAGMLFCVLAIWLHMNWLLPCPAPATL